MGKAILEREFAARPPTTQLNSITALWQDYMARYVNNGRGDPALPWTLKAKTLEVAIHRACMSRGKDGTLWHHQGRVWQVNLEAYEMKLQFEYFDQIEESETFEELMSHMLTPLRERTGSVR